MLEMLKQIHDFLDKAASFLKSLADMLSKFVPTDGPVLKALNFGGIFDSLKKAALEWFVKNVLPNLLSQPALA